MVQPWTKAALTHIFEKIELFAFFNFLTFINSFNLHHPFSNIRHIILSTRHAIRKCTSLKSQKMCTIALWSFAITYSMAYTDTDSCLGYGPVT